MARELNDRRLSPLPFRQRSAARCHIGNASADRDSDFKLIPTEMHRAVSNMAAGNLFQINRQTLSHTRLLLSRTAQDGQTSVSVKSPLTTVLAASLQTKLPNAGRSLVPATGAALRQVSRPNLSYEE